VCIVTVNGSLHLLQLIFMLLVGHVPLTNSTDAMLSYWLRQTRPAASPHVPYGNFDAKMNAGYVTISAD
jgi:hypothetical protein